MRSFFFLYLPSNKGSCHLLPERPARWVRQSRYSTVTCYRSKQKSHCVGRELGVGKGKASEVGQGGGQGRTLAEPTACGLNACPWVCAGALWELCCDRPLGALGRFPPVFHLWLWSRPAAMTVCILFGVCALKCWHPAIICYDPTG